jgi:hypothetical protein
MRRDFSYMAGNKFAKGQRPNRTAFKKGLVPWNKGRHILNSPNCLKTAFKKGIKPHNTVPIGTVTVRADKNGTKRRWIKISNKSPRWKIYSQWLWEKRRGKIPSGLIVHHLDGDSMNDRIKNYGLVTRAQHINTHRKDLSMRRKRKLLQPELV